MKKTVLLMPLALALSVISSHAAITIADSFSFNVDVAQVGSGYSSGLTAGNDTGGGDLYSADKPITINTTLAASGTSKLVLAIAYHNSAATIPGLTILSYGGVDLLANQVLADANNSFLEARIYYIDSPTVSNGNIVMNWASGNIDEVSFNLYALNGTAAGTAYYTQATTGAALDTFAASAGDFVVGLGTRNNGTQHVNQTADYTNTALKAGNLNAATADWIVDATGTITAPSFNNTPSVQMVAAFAAIPEPSSLGLATIAGLLFIRRRR